MFGVKVLFDEVFDVVCEVDVVVFVGGFIGDVEGEEMMVNYLGFVGGDCIDLWLFVLQCILLEVLYVIGKLVVMVFIGGLVIVVDWVQVYLLVILMSWYFGQCGGIVVGQVLFGDINLVGCLLVIFYKVGEVMLVFDDYVMEGCIYCYFCGMLLYLFGYGLLYMCFDYGMFCFDVDIIGVDGCVVVLVDVINVGMCSGDEVVQLYVWCEYVGGGDVVQELWGFQWVYLVLGECCMVMFILEVVQVLCYYDEVCVVYVVQFGVYEVRVGVFSVDICVWSRFILVFVYD